MPHFRIKQGRMIVAKATGKDAEREIMHYAMQYRQDGELTIDVLHASQSDGGKPYWKRFALLAKWPDPQAVE